MIEKYVDCLCNEISIYGSMYGKNSLKERRTVTSVFFGGGTPSLLTSALLDKIMDTLRQCFDFTEEPEITIECNPGTTSFEKLSSYKSMGINRISIGLQSACDNELISLGRIHNYNDFMKTYNDARNAHFNNINIDLMSALPGQTLASYKNTLLKITSLNPEHISAYSLIIEENTPFYDIYSDYKGNCGFPPLPDEETEREMYYVTNDTLSAHNYSRYEISNYSKSGYECKHNILYWSRGEYLGFGLGASSFIHNTRYSNTPDIKQYINLLGNTDSFSTSLGEKSSSLLNCLTTDVSLLSDKDAMEEYMFLGLRMMKGISKSCFKKTFNRDIDTIYCIQLEKFKREGLISENGDNIALTLRGIDVSNYIFSEFIL